MSEWRETTLGKLAVAKGLIGGPFGSSLVGKDYAEAGVPVIRGENLNHGRGIGGEFVFVSEEKFSRDLVRNAAVRGDLIYTQRGTLGQVAIVESGQHDRYVVSQSQMRLRVVPTIADALYVYYASRSPLFLRQIDDNAIATGVPHINLGILSRLTVPLPPMPVQRAIAEVLGALDDKIAANTQVATTADELACAEFRRLATGVEFSNQTFADVASIGGGGTPRSNVLEYWEGGVPWLTPTDVTALPGLYVTETNRTISTAGLASISSALYPAGSIFMTSRATIGAFALAEKPMAVNQGFIVVRPNEPGLRYWLFHEMRDRVPEFLDHANGATFMELSRGNFKKLPVRLADEAVMESFGRRAAALHARASAGLAENRMLAATRDALLPALMSGRMTIRDAEAAVEAVA